MSECMTCQSPKANLKCGVCDSTVCKSCAHFVDEESLIFMQPVPPQLLHDAYCSVCFDQTVEPIQARYRETIERAKNVNVFFKTQGKETRFIRRSEKPLKIANCPDRDETLLRLAFLAAQAGFNALIDVDISSEKVRLGGWQTSKWQGTGIPAKVDDATLARKFISAPN